MINAIELTNKELRKMQLIQVEMLHELHRIAIKNDIKYTIAAGTLLGAYREGKFIPWDDDIDIRILRSEYEKLCVAMEKDLNKEKFFFQNVNTDKNYNWQYAKILRNNTRYVRVGKEHLKQKDGVYLDIFVCDGIPKNKIIRKIHNTITLFCRKSMYAKMAYKIEKNTFKRLGYSVIRFVPKFVVFWLYKVLGKIFNENNCNTFGSYGWHGYNDNHRGFYKKWFENLTLIDFEDGRFYAPKETKEFLEHSFYGDIKKPPIEARKPKAYASYFKF